MTAENELLIGFHVEPAERLLLPPPASSVRKDELWKTTCFEIFLRDAGEERYWEYNFSPSSEWAAYAFDRYREGMREADLALAPHIEIMQKGAHFHLAADIGLAGLPRGRLSATFSAVIEESNGAKSYWAVAHPSDKPDFHHPACFTAILAPPDKA